jgi:hypothetical protein
MNEKILNQTENIYNNLNYDRSKAQEYVEKISVDFREYYISLGYQEHPPVDISSGVDPTVRFIGSHISVFKPDILDGKIPEPGEFMIQGCIRTKNISKVYDDTYSPNWGSHFVSMGLISNYERLQDVVDECVRFFTQKLNISESDIQIRVSSTDKDLLQASSSTFKSDSIEIDSKVDSYYRHGIGIDGVLGRNFNIALRNPMGEGFSDVGNIIVLETDEKKIAVEVALGSSTILKQLYNLKHVNDCYPILELDIEDEKIKRKLEDSLIVSVILWREGLEPKATNNQSRLLRSYVRAISYLRLNKVRDVMFNFEKKQFPLSNEFVTDKIIEYLKSYEEKLVVGDISTKEDSIIANLLK